MDWHVVNIWQYVIGKFLKEVYIGTYVSVNSLS